MSERTVQSIDRAFSILETLSLEKNGLGVTQISNRLALHKSTVHRLLLSMAERGYIEKMPLSGNYRLGVKFVELSSMYLNNIELKTEAQPYLRRLAALTGQAVHLATRVESQAVYIDKVESINNLRMYSAIGKRIPLYSSAVGKVLLMDLKEKDIREIFKNNRFIKLTDKTIDNIEDLLGEIERVRQKGYAVDDEENEDGIRCFAAPIYDYRNQIIAGISTSGLCKVFTDDRLDEISCYVTHAAKEISIHMGFTGI